MNSVNGLPIPFPPLELANRVGAIADQPNPFELYTGIGAGTREYLLKVLPDDWSFAGKRVLDFGCGAGGRFATSCARPRRPRSGAATSMSRASTGCATTSVRRFMWCTNGPTPPLAFADNFFDFVYVISVFTHLTDSWSAWLLEMHRVLADDGILVATFMGEGLCEIMSGEPWVEDRIGMNVYSHDQGWDKGGPMVLHSPWWIRAHWGRAFEIIDLHPYGFGHGFLDRGSPTRASSSCASVRVPSRSKISKRLEPHEPRERVALHHMIDVLQCEVSHLRAYARSVQSTQG